jgi:hypothetical protein
LLDNMAAGVGMGLAIGVAMGLAAGAENRKDKTR